MTAKTATCNDLTINHQLSHNSNNASMPEKKTIYHLWHNNYNAVKGDGENPAN
jgi:hypothetical protein